MYVVVFQTFNIQTILVLSKYFTSFLYRTQVNSPGAGVGQLGLSSDRRPKPFKRRLKFSNRHIKLTNRRLILIKRKVNSINRRLKNTFRRLKCICCQIKWTSSQVKFTKQYCIWL